MPPLPDPAPVDVSVVVPTFNRSTLLLRTLESLTAQRAESVTYEVIVVDNDSRDDTAVVVRTFMDRAPMLRYCLERRPGVSSARNRGIAESRAPIVAFIDDDNEADAGWIAGIKAFLDANPEVDCVGGRIEGRFTVAPPSWLTPQHWGPIALQSDKGVTANVDADNAGPCLLTANFAARRAALEEVGGFSAEFLRDEDRELQLRLWSAGKRGRYHGGLVVRTDVPPDRLTKAYHRAFHTRNGASHARMRYLDRVDRDGRLMLDGFRHVTLFGAPAFVYRELLARVCTWALSIACLRPDRAFFHEIRARYLANYIWFRVRERRRSVPDIFLELARFVRTRIARRAGVAAPAATARGRSLTVAPGAGLHVERPRSLRRALAPPPEGPA